MFLASVVSGSIFGQTSIVVSLMEGEFHHLPQWRVCSIITIEYCTGSTVWAYCPTSRVHLFSEEPAPAPAPEAEASSLSVTGLSLRWLLLPLHVLKGSKQTSLQDARTNKLDSSTLYQTRSLKNLGAKK